MRKIKSLRNGDAVVNVYFDYQNMEYVVSTPSNPEATYYSDDRDDALDTAEHMLQEVSHGLPQQD